MKYGQIAGNRHINALIYRCFEYICEEDERKFVRRFREQPHDSDEIMHTFRELVLGAYLCSQGSRARHDYVVDGHTPDWSILDDESELAGIVELTSFHIDKATETEIEEQVRVRRIGCYWRDANKDNVDRLYQSIWAKAQVYQALGRRLQVPYVVAVFGEFKAAVDLEEARLCLFDEEAGLFDMYPEMSGVLYFEENSGRYSFSYTRNPNASQAIDFPAGVFPPEPD